MPPIQILVVDDEPMQGKLLELSLLRIPKVIKVAVKPMQITVALNGEAALQLVEAGLRPDLLVTDLVMTGMDGIQLIRTLFERLPNAKPRTILITAMSRPELKENAAAGCELYLTKPVRAEVLCQQVIELCPEFIA